MYCQIHWILLTCRKKLKVVFFFIKGNRPSVEELEDFLLRNQNWILPKLFNGASAEIVAHALVGMYSKTTETDIKG